MDELTRLVEIEAIKQLKGRYQRAVDTKDWDLMATLFTEDAKSVYDGGKYTYEGRDEIVGFLREGLGTPAIQSMHHAHTPEIEILGETTARGTWYLEDFVITAIPSEGSPQGTVLHGTGIYQDEYRKEEGGWLISLTGYERIFTDVQNRSEAARLKTRWDGA